MDVDEEHEQTNEGGQEEEHESEGDEDAEGEDAEDEDEGWNIKAEEEQTGDDQSVEGGCGVVRPHNVLLARRASLFVYA